MIFLGAQGQSGERLGFAAGKESGTVHARSKPTSEVIRRICRGAAVGTAAGVENIIAENFFSRRRSRARLVKGAFLVHLLLGLFGNRFNDLILESITR